MKTAIEIDKSGGVHTCETRRVILVTNATLKVNSEVLEISDHQNTIQLDYAGAVALLERLPSAIEKMKTTQTPPPYDYN